MCCQVFRNIAIVISLDECSVHISNAEEQNYVGLVMLLSSVLIGLYHISDVQSKISKTIRACKNRKKML